MRIDIEDLLNSLYALETVTNAGKECINSSEVLNDVQRFCKERGILLISQSDLDEIVEIQTTAVKASCAKHEENIDLQNQLEAKISQLKTLCQAHRELKDKYAHLHEKYCDVVQKYCPREAEIFYSYE